ncbi:MAG: hypothetical protein M1544_02395 [Candidatus Marsarchaeota archaeon]|nr:hypothetical protein [Candidatus Marsarchaeota archaeon]MCL5102182.1 hypothetical protein [Candidatus Marsarchaeota archaeon]
MNRVKVLSSIYKKPKYLGLNAVAFIIYYYIMHGIVLINNKIILFSGTIAEYTFYAIAITSSILITIAVFSVFNTRNNKAKISASASGSAIALASSFAVSCGCSFSSLSYLAVLGLSSGALISLDNAIANYETPLLLAALVVNILIIIYYVNKLSNPACSLKGRKTNKNAKRR